MFQRYDPNKIILELFMGISRVESSQRADQKKRLYFTPMAFLPILALVALFKIQAQIEDDFFQLMATALQSVGIEADEYSQAPTVFLESPRITNVGRQERIEFSFVDVHGAGSQIELQMRVPAENLLATHGPLSRLIRVAATERVLDYLQDSLEGISDVSEMRIEKNATTGTLVARFAIKPGKVFSVAQSVLTVILEGRQLVHMVSLESELQAGAADPCAPAFGGKNKTWVH